MELNLTYIIRVKISEDKILTYQATITKEDDVFIYFTDKFKKTYQYNKNAILSIEGPIK